MSRFSDAVAQLRRGLVIAEDTIKTIGEVAHVTADSLADKIRDFRDGNDNDQGQGGNHAAR